MINDRLSFMRFLGLDLHEKAPDAGTIWLFREHLAKADAVETLYNRFDRQLRRKGYLAMGGQIVDANLVEAPKQCLTKEEKETVKPRQGESGQGWRGARGADHPGLWLQEPHQYRSPSQADPQVGGDGCFPA